MGKKKFSVNFRFKLRNLNTLYFYLNIVLLQRITLLIRILNKIESVVVSVNSCIHTYIIGHNKLSVRIRTQLLTPLMLGVILYMSGGSYSLNSPPNDRFFFIAILYTLSVSARNFLKGSRGEIFYHISFSQRCRTCCLNRGLSSNKIYNNSYTITRKELETKGVATTCV